jgi:hypothetical protein
LISAISSKSFLVSLPIFFLFGSPEPVFCPIFHKIRFDVTGFPISRLNVLSANIVSLAFTFTSAQPKVFIISIVLSLNSFMNCQIFTPFAQSIGPRGGAGCAFPAGTSKFRIFIIFAIFYNS